MKINSELLKGNTTLLVLNLLDKEDMYGYMMIKELEQKSEKIFELSQGTLYPILHSLEGKNYIDSYWDESTSKKRKYYTITKLGKKILTEKKKEWQVFSTSVNKVLGGVSFAN